MSIDGKTFIRTVCPLLQEGNPERLACVVRKHWQAHEVCELLGDEDVDVRRVAAVVVGLIADCQASNCLARALRDPDPHVCQMAEHSLWSIWFRGGKPEAAKPFSEGIALLSTDSLRQAIESFNRAIAIDPDFPEAYNQRAIAHYLLSEWKEAIEDCREVIRRVPFHFGALSGMGNCHLQAGDLVGALDAYRRALRVNPHMSGVADVVRCIEQRIKDNNDSSGIYGSDRVNA